MALVLADRVRETTSVVGTGAATLLGAALGYQSFATVGNGNTTYYVIADQGGANWEVGIGSWATGGTLTRTTVISSSNANALVSFSAGTKDVFVTYPASQSAYGNGSVLTVPSTAILPFANGGTGASSASAALTSLGAYAATNPTGYQTSAQVVTAITGYGYITSAGTSAACSGNSATATTANALNTANNYQITSLGIGIAANGTAGDIVVSRTASPTTGVIYFGNSGGRYLYYDGTSYQLPTASLVVGGNVTAYSDERVKTNWRDLQPNFIEQLSKVKHGIYDRTDQVSTQIGVGAQSLRPVMEHAVMEDADGNLSVAYGNAALVSAIQLAKELVALKDIIKELTAKVEALEAR